MTYGNYLFFNEPRLSRAIQRAVRRILVANIRESQNTLKMKARNIRFLYHPEWEFEDPATGEWLIGSCMAWKAEMVDSAETCLAGKPVGAS